MCGALLRAIKKYNVDTKRIGAYGNSAGAHLVCMLGLVKEANMEETALIKSIQLSSGRMCLSFPTNFLLFDNQRKGQRTQPGELFAGSVETLEEQARKTSNYVAADTPPFLLVHGTADTTVNIKHGDLSTQPLKGWAQYWNTYGLKVTVMAYSTNRRIKHALPWKSSSRRTFVENRFCSSQVFELNGWIALF